MCAANGRNGGGVGSRRSLGDDVFLDLKRLTREIGLVTCDVSD